MRLTFNNPDLILKPDMHVTVNIISDLGKNILALPQEAVIRTGVRNIVFVELEKGQFEPRQVKLGATSDDGYVEVLQGLLRGEDVVTSGQFLLDSESQTREAIQKMLAAKSAQSGQEEQMPDESKEIKKKNAVQPEMKCATGKCGQGK